MRLIHKAPLLFAPLLFSLVSCRSASKIPLLGEVQAQGINVKIRVHNIGSNAKALKGWRNSDLIQWKSTEGPFMVAFNPGESPCGQGPIAAFPTVYPSIPSTVTQGAVYKASCSAVLPISTTLYYEVDPGTDPTHLLHKFPVKPCTGCYIDPAEEDNN